MSDPVSKPENAEDVEDVLSSIKRLVSATGEAAGKEVKDVEPNTPSAPVSEKTDVPNEQQSAKPTALLLTSALRVLPAAEKAPATDAETEESTLDSLRKSVSESIVDDTDIAAKPDPEPEHTSPVEKAAHLWVAPKPVSDYYEDEAAEEQAVTGAELAPEPDSEPEPAPETEAASAPEDVDIGEAELEAAPLTDHAAPHDIAAQEAEDISETQAADSPETSSEHAAQSEAETESPTPVEEAQEPYTQPDMGDDTLSADADLDPNDVEDAAHLSEPQPEDQDQSAAFGDEDWNLDDLGNADILHESTNWHADGETTAFSATEPWDEVTPVGQAPFSRAADDADIAGIATFVRSGREVTYTEVESHDVGGAQSIEDAETIEATPSDAAEDAATVDMDEALLDEDVLRELVAEIVREELTGALGERITRNVRKLVRQEINRALAAQELD